ncbi:hypothetical protein [Anatilimnocola floriformis]|uniref:hypothetical protein n=1 Tax=Anatilimnocola floriformis TaxID=2948575 RepID=UPI0020C31469|nr:hypothetical protein [Anatilimnocola floriformis]
MSIALQCEHCQHALHVNDGLAGKRIKCPQCQSPIVVPGGAGEPVSDFMHWAGEHAGGVEHDVKWYLQTFSGKQYGPVDRRLLDYWQRLGAVSARSQVLREGDTQWRWASELYPQLAVAAPEHFAGE